MSAYHIKGETVASYIQAIENFEIIYLLGYPSALFELARGITKQGLSVPDLKVVICNAEPLFDEQRELISRAFRCPVRNTYGMAEMVCGAGECEAGKMHIWSDAGLLEVLDDDDQPAPPGTVGRIVCTGFVNEEMPLIRYEVGDLGALGEPDEACDCGRTLPTLCFIEGRIDDVVFTPDGRRVGRLDTVFKTNLPIREAQIVQVSTDRLMVNMVPADGFDQRAEGKIRALLRERVGEMGVDFNYVVRIPRGSNGKFRGVINEL
jgi:phenylacetate-CoA ligase